MNKENKILDIVVIFRDSDKDYLQDLQKSIPSYAKLILVRTIQSDKDVLSILQNDNDVTFATLEYSGVFSFGYARNQALKLSESKFILSLDADERLLTHQHQQLYLHLLEYNELSDFGGAMMYNVSVKTFSQNKYGLYNTEIMPQTKLFIKGSFWIGDIHENISIPKGTILYTTPILIHHIGYEISKEKRAEKITEYHRIALNEKRKSIVNKQKEQLTANDLLKNIKQQLIKGVA